MPPRKPASRKPAGRKFPARGARANPQESILFARRTIDVPTVLMSLVLALLVFGLIGVYSASARVAGQEERNRVARAGGDVTEVSYYSPSYLNKQLIWAGLGLAAMAFFAHFDYRKLKKGSFWIMAACFIACCLVWAPGIGPEIKGAHRWLRVGSLGIQPSEFAKLGLIIYMAKMLDERHQYITSFFSGVMPALVVTGAFAVVIVLEPDFGAALVLCSIIFGMWVCGEMRWFHLGGLASAAIPAGLMGFALKPYRVRRILAFFSDDPEVRLQEGYQLYQSQIAIGSGGPWGLGLGNSMQKFHYLSEAHNDFIFAILAEELGFFRVSIIIGLFAALVALGWWVALNASDLFGSLLATGITLMIFLGASINVGVALGLLPTTGLTLPFISSGGSSLLVSMSAVGILINIARRQFGFTQRRRAR